MSVRGNVRSRAAAGFTLLELILVMFVVFTLAAVVAPRFSDFFPSLQVRTAADRLLAWCGKAHAEAVLTGSRHRLVIDPQARTFWIAWESRPLKKPGKFEILRGSWDTESLPGEVVVGSFKGFETEEGSASARYVEFGTDGTAADASLEVSNDRGDRRTLRIDATTGAASIEVPGEPSAAAAGKGSP